MLIYPHTLSIITTHRCTAACDHCCFNCNSDKSHPSIPIANIHKYVEQAAEVKSFKMVVLTGGECFLLGKHLDEVVATITRNGLQSRFVSNGYWATSPLQAKRRLSTLVANGLGEANFSTGDAHMKYVPPEYVMNGAIAAADFGLTVFVMMELHSESRFDFEGFVGNPRIKPYLESRKIIIQNSPWMRFQGKQELTYSERYMLEMNSGRVGGCSTILKVIAITPTESLVSCCGLTLEEIEELHLGSLKERSVGQILRESPDDFVKIWVHLQGPDAVMRYAKTIDPTIEIADNAAHICEACRHMYKDPKVVKAILGNPPPNRADIVRQYTMNLMQPLGTRQIESNKSAYQKACTVDRMRQMRHGALTLA